MALRLGDLAPNFTAATTEGKIDFHQWLGKGWGVLFSHPADYTPVCTTELGAVAQIKERVRKAQREGDRGQRGSDRIPTTAGSRTSMKLRPATMNFPIIADPDRKVATAYDMIHPNADDKATVRSVFVIGPDKKIKLTITYPASTGRNFWRSCA